MGPDAWTSLQAHARIQSHMLERPARVAALRLLS